MFRYFIMLKKDDEIFNPFIKISEVHGREDFEEINLNSVHRALKYVIPSLVQGGLGYRPKARLNAHSPFNQP